MGELITFGHDAAEQRDNGQVNGLAAFSKPP